jgi:hypothetical protein
MFLIPTFVYIYHLNSIVFRKPINKKYSVSYVTCAGEGVPEWLPLMSR